MKSKKLTLLPALALIAALVGCGGSSGSGSRGAAGTTTTTNATTKAITATQPPRRGQAKPHGGPAPTDPNPLPNQGTKEAARGVPTSTGGDNSIQIFGLEGKSADRIEAAAVAKAYLEARAAGRWAEACSYVAASTKAQMGALFTRDKKPVGCEGALKAFSAGPKSALRSAADIRVLSFRVKGNRAFLIYRDGRGTPSALPMGREGGTWKLGALGGSPLLL